MSEYHPAQCSVTLHAELEQLFTAPVVDRGVVERLLARLHLPALGTRPRPAA